jgi:hypothetical protein
MRLGTGSLFTLLLVPIRSLRCRIFCYQCVASVLGCPCNMQLERVTRDADFAKEADC